MIMSDLKGKIWMDGKLVEWSDAKIHVLTHTLHYGTGVFEGVRAYETSDGPAIFRLEDHTNRLFESAKLIGMKIPYDKKELNDAQSKVVKINNLKNAYIRPMCFYGSEGMGLRADNLKVHAIIAAWGWGSYLGDDKILNGITRQTVMKIARDLNYNVEETNISVDDVKSSSEAFFTGTAAEVTPIIQVDNVKIQDGKPGEITKKIQKIYFDTIRGKVDEYDLSLIHI